MRKISSSPDAVDRGGRPHALNERHILALREIVAEDPGRSLDAVTALLHQRCGVGVAA